MANFKQTRNSVRTGTRLKYPKVGLVDDNETNIVNINGDRLYTGPSAIHIPHSQDLLSYELSYLNGTKYVTNIFSDETGYNLLGSGSRPPGVEEYKSIGLVWGESSITKRIPKKPTIISGVEQKFRYDRAEGSSGIEQITELKGFFSDSKIKNIKMEYLYHEGQEVINSMPKVSFDGENLTVDCTDSDIIESTHIWYVINNLGGLSLSICIFVSDFICYEDIFVYDPEFEPQQTCHNGCISDIVNSDLITKKVYDLAKDDFYQKVNEFFDIIENESFTWTGGPSSAEHIIINNKFTEIDNIYNTLQPKLQEWLDFDVIPDVVGEPDLTTRSARCLSSLAEYYDNLLSKINELKIEFDTVACVWKDGVNVPPWDVTPYDFCGQPPNTNEVTIGDQYRFNNYNRLTPFHSLANYSYFINHQEGVKTNKRINNHHIDLLKKSYIDKIYEYGLRVHAVWRAKSFLETVTGVSDLQALRNLTETLKNDYTAP